jgi:hypothetical protein
MGFIVKFDYKSYQDALLYGKLDPPGVFAPFIKVDRAKYHALSIKSNRLDLSHLKNRTNSDMFMKFRGAIGFTQRHARKYFPAFKFLCNELVNDEWLSMVDWHKKFHRDHLIHQPMSIFVGLSLLNGSDISGRSPGIIEFGNKSLLDLCIDTILEPGSCDYLLNYFKCMGPQDIFFNNTPLARELWKWLFLDTFYLATIFHDIGYPWRFINIVNDKLDSHAPRNNESEISKDWIKNKFSDRLIFYPLSGYRKPDPTEPANWAETFDNLLKDGLNKTHGMPGALSLLHLNDLIRESLIGLKDRPASRFCIEWASMAVMMHDMAGIYGEIDGNFLKIKNPHMRISFKRDPMSFLLTLTDHIQDFERPNAEFVNRNKDCTEVNYKASCNRVKVELDGRQKYFNITYRYSNVSDYIKNKYEFLPKNELLYFNPDTGFLDFSGLPISRIKLNAEM